jgi:thiamine biosynthesis lipoprotein
MIAPPMPSPSAIEAEPGVVSVSADLMGGRVAVQLRPAPAPVEWAGAGERRDDLARGEAGRVLRRIARWSERLTRFNSASELSRFNADPAGSVTVGPTLGSVLRWSREAAQLSHGFVDVTLLDARLTAEHVPGTTPADGGRADAPAAEGAWSLANGRRRGQVGRAPGVRFDLDGVAKGWLADRAVALLQRHPAAVVDADGDVAFSLAFGQLWHVEVADPRTPGTNLALLELAGQDPAGRQRFGCATSGTSVHRWVRAGRTAHHLIDPRTGRPALTDVVQATVLAGSAAAAEALAKTIVILGSEDALELLAEAPVRAAIILTERGDVLATPSTIRWLA